MRTIALCFSPTGGTRRAAGMLAGGIAAHWDWIDLSLPLSGRALPALTGEDVALIAAPSFGGRMPELAAERLRAVQGGGARAVLLSVYGNRNDDDTLFDLRDAAVAEGFAPVAAVRAIAEHSIVRQVASGRPDTQDEAILHGFGQQIAQLLQTAPDARLTLPEKDFLRPYGGLPFHPKAGKACTGCGKCASLCPVGAIPHDNPALTDERACITCMRCVRICPAHARQLPPLMLAAAGHKLKKRCAERREPELLLGEKPSRHKRE